MMTFWAALKATRSLAYFKSALNTGGTGDLKQKWNQNPGWREKILLSGVIAAATIAISGRTIYRALKRRKKSPKNDKSKGRENIQKARKASQEAENFDNARKNNSNSVPQNTKNENVKPKNTETVLNNEKLDNKFLFDERPQQLMYGLKDTLSKMKFVENNDQPNSVKVEGSNKTFYLNGSGIFDKNHNEMIRSIKQKVKASELLIGIPKNEYDDLILMLSFYDS